VQGSCLALLEIVFRHLCGRTEEEHQKPKDFTEYNEQDATFLNLFISVRRSTYSDGFSIHHQELKTAHTASGICQTNTVTCR